jgi:hypothetical protein
MYLAILWRDVAAAAEDQAPPENPRRPRTCRPILARMVTPAAFRKLALSLPEAYEEPHFERASFRVKKRIFATLAEDQQEAMVRVSPPEAVNALLEEHPETFFSYGGWTVRNGSLGVRLAHVDPGLLKELLTEAWKLLAGRGKRGAVEGTGRRGGARRG